jgi:hypothetical protein
MSLINNNETICVRCGRSEKSKNCKIVSLEKDFNLTNENIPYYFKVLRDYENLHGSDAMPSRYLVDLHVDKYTNFCMCSMCKICIHENDGPLDSRICETCGLSFCLISIVLPLNDKCTRCGISSVWTDFDRSDPNALKCGLEGLEECNELKEQNDNLERLANIKPAKRSK